MSWELFQKDVYGFIEEGGEGGYNFQPMMDKDYRRWHKADSDRDGKLT